MKKKLSFLITFGLLYFSVALFGQQIDFTIKYNTSDDLYEVYGKADFNQDNFFVGGGSQLSLVIPSIVANSPLSINSINGGIWFDNSQVYTPDITPNLDYHGIASNGSQMNWVTDAEVLLFTFSIPSAACTGGVRLFENQTDPTSNEPSMFGADFGNYFVNVFTFDNHYRSNYDNEGIPCDKPYVEVPPISTPVNTQGQGCGTVIDLNGEDVHMATICQQGSNGTAVVNVDNDTDELCLNFQPDTDFVGKDSVCIELCDEAGNCVEAMVGITVFEFVNCNNSATPIIEGNSVICFGDRINLSTEDLGANYSYQWTNANGSLVGEGANLSLSSENVQAIPPFQVSRSLQNCPSATSSIYPIEVINFSNVQINNGGGIVCEGGDVTLNATGLNGGTYRWYNAITNQLVATGDNPTINNIQQSLTLRLEVDYRGCTNQNQPKGTSIQVESKPIIADIPRSITVCRGEDVLITPIKNPANGGDIRYLWSGPNDFTFKNNTTTDSFPLFLEDITPEQAGAYSINLTSENGCAIDSRSVVINVADNLVAPQLIARESIVCNGGRIELTASLQNEEAVVFEWYLQNSTGALFLLDQTNVPSFIIDQPTSVNAGKYLVRVRDGNCVSGYSNTEIIEVLDGTTTIDAINSTDSDNPVCQGGFVQLSVPFIEGATYQWFGPAGFTSDKYNPFINAINSFNAGDYFAVISTSTCPGIVTTPTTVYLKTGIDAPIISGASILCERNELVLNVDNYQTVSEGTDLMTIWYHAETGTIIDTTFDGRLTIEELKMQDAGQYYAVFTNESCVSTQSNRITVEVVTFRTLVAEAGRDVQLCEVAPIDLSANSIIQTTGTWTSLGSASIANATDAEATATNLQAGDNLFVWTIENACGQTAKDTINVQVLSESTVSANAGIDIGVCEVNAINMSASTNSMATGLWSQSMVQADGGVRIINSTAANTQITGLIPGNVYRFTWTLSTNSCPNYSADEVLVTISEQPDELAFIGADNELLTVCEGEESILAAETPLFSTGEWSSNAAAQIINPTSPQTIVSNLPVGYSSFTWSLSSGACKDFSTTTLSAYRPENLAANADRYIINLNDSLNFNVFENDQFKERGNLDFTITKYPDRGTLKEAADGTITYVPQNNYFGEDNFRYKICDKICEEVCDTAIVSLFINGSDGASGLCFIPNIITPNGDGLSDQFQIGCLNEFPDAAIKIFNRWGDIVYEAAPYANDWEGTHEGNPLPAGTYYYYLKLNPESPPIQDFFSLFR